MVPLAKENMLKITFDGERVFGVFHVNNAIWVLTSQRIVEVKNDLTVSTLYRFNVNLSVSKAVTYGESLYFISNGLLFEFKKTHGLREVSKLQVTPIDFCVNPERTLFVYLLLNQLKINTIDMEKVVHLSELYRGVQCFVKRENVFLLLIGLWGYTAVNLEGRLEFYKTFGDIVNDVKMASIGKSNYILTGSKNGSLYVGDDKGDIINSVSLGKSLSKFDFTIQSDMFYIVWVGFDGSINLLELSRDGEVRKFGALESLEFDIENVATKVTENKELLVAVSEKNKLVLLKKKI